MSVALVRRYGFISGVTRPDRINNGYVSDILT